MIGIGLVGYEESRPLKAAIGKLARCRDDGFAVTLARRRVCRHPSARNQDRVHATHSLRQPRLKRLIDDASAIRKIGRAAIQKIREGENEGLAAAACFQHRESVACFRHLNLPDALAGIAAVLLDDPRPGCLQPSRKRILKFPAAARFRSCRHPGPPLRRLSNRKCTRDDVSMEDTAS
jgi:hypothetical protein